MKNIEKRQMKYCLLCLGLYWFATDSVFAQDDDAKLPETVAESSDYKSTSTSAEVIEFIDACVAKGEHVSKFEFGKTFSGKPMVGAIISAEPYQLGQRDERMKVLLLGNIHSGECAGKEALLRMMRELTHHPDHAWLKQMVILIAPNYNADGNDKMGKRNRPGQVGPENGMGVRHNSQNFDLNRDFVKLDSPEARALIGLIDLVNPHLFVDCHTTNGSVHRYQLTYDVPHNLSSPEPMRNFMRDKMMTTVTERLEKKGINTFYYGNFNSAKTIWGTYGHEPRYSTEYVGLRGRIAILSEAYSYISYRQRIEATHAFVSECLTFADENAGDIRQLLDSVEKDFVAKAKADPKRITMTLNAKQVPFKKKYMIKGVLDDKPHDFEVDFIGDFRATRTVPLPYAYLLSGDFETQIRKLQQHGIQVLRTTDTVKLDVEKNEIKGIQKSPRKFQQHLMVALDVETSESEIEVPVGTYVVLTAQPLGRLASYMLEPASNDGLTTWNFFDDHLEEGKMHPVWRVNEPVHLPSEKAERIPDETE